MKIDLTMEEIKFIQEILGQLPTHSNAWPLVQKIANQINSNEGESAE